MGRSSSMEIGGMRWVLMLALVAVCAVSTEDSELVTELSAGTGGVEAFVDVSEGRFINKATKAATKAVAKIKHEGKEETKKPPCKKPTAAAKKIIKATKKEEKKKKVEGKENPGEGQEG